MANMKHLLHEYAEKNYLEPDLLTDNEALKIQTKIFLDYYEPHYDEVVKEFFLDIFGNVCCFDSWLMISEDEATYNLKCDTLWAMLEYTAILSRFKYNLYFCPNVFDGWRKDCNVVATNTIFIDIDDVGDVDFSTMTTDELTLWLIETYDVPRELLPNWCVCSGHGLHMYYIIEKLDLTNEENQATRAEFTDYLITYFGADKACRNSSRVLRVPKSYNVKSEERMTTLHHINKSDNYDLMRLYYFYRPKYVIDDYMQECQEKKNEKSRATRAKNRKQQGEENTEKKVRVRKEYKRKQNEIHLLTRSDQEKIQEMRYYTDFSPKARYWNMVKDLHNYYLRHQGMIHGHRNMFFLIMATYLKKLMPLEKALEFLDKYVSRDMKEEAVLVIERVYMRENDYRFRNITIAEMLGFTEEDIQKSYCNFSEERMNKARDAALRRSNKKLAEKRKKERAVVDQRTFVYIAVKDNHANLTTKQLADYCGVSERTIKRVRKRIREENQ